MKAWQDKLPKSWREQWVRWLNNRIPLSKQITLGHRTIFIVPNRTGWLFAAILIVMLVTAVNYQNSLIYGLVFWLFSTGLTAMMFTFRNLSGLTLAAGHAYPCFAGEVVELPVRLIAPPKQAYWGLQLGFTGQPAMSAGVAKDETHSLSLSYRTEQRGYAKPGRFRLETRYPVGIYTSWSWVGLDFGALVYPKPEWVPFIFRSGEGGEDIQGASAQQSGQQDFYGLRNYQPGDSLRQIAWKQLAKGRGLVTKEFDSDEGATCWLDWDVLAPASTETRLSRLCGWVLQAHQNGWRYGLRLPGTEIAPDNSDAHRDQCLQALALYDLPNSSSGAEAKEPAKRAQS